MSGAVYVHNVSSLQLPRLVLREGRGFADLMPNELGKLSEDVAKQPRVQNWIATGRLKIISEEEFQRSFASKEKGKDEAYATYKAKAHPEKQPDGATVVVPGLEELPEVDKIPEPEVTNIDGTISIRAPEGEPLTEAAGDPIEVEKSSLRPKILESDGSLSEMTPSRPKQDAVSAESTESTETAETAESTEETSESSSESENKTAEANLPEAPVVLSDVLVEPIAPGVGSIEEQVSGVLKFRAWKQQVKALKQVTNPEVILQIAEKSPTEAVKKACAERLQELA